MSERHEIGANNPPRTIFDDIDDLYFEAQGWLDGDAIDSDAQARGLGALMDAIKSAAKVCEAERMEKVAPLNQQKDAIQSIYNPYIGKDVGKVSRALKIAGAVRDKWLKAKQSALDEAARIARQKADQERQMALQAMHDSRNNLAARQDAEALVEQARIADFTAIAAAKATPETIGGRKTVTQLWEPVLVDGANAAAHYWTVRRADMERFLFSLAIADVKAGKREIPGFIVKDVE